jgi:uncharacterized protein
MTHDSSRHKQVADDNRILLTEVGSGLHGVSIAGIDDHDEMGVCIEPPDCVIGLEKFEQYQDRWHADGSRIREGERSGPGDTDHVVYSLRKYVRLAAQGNPTVLLPLFAPQHKVLDIKEPGTRLRFDRTMFLSKQAGWRFHGYLRAQQERMLGLRGSKPVEEHGYNTKMAYHAIRLGLQGRELMEHQTITLPMTPEHRERLLSVRSGDWTLAQVTHRIDEVAADLVNAIPMADLPNEPDPDAINSWLIGRYQEWWATSG